MYDLHVCVCVNVYGIFIMYWCSFVVVVDMCPPMMEIRISIAVVTEYAVPKKIKWCSVVEWFTACLVSFDFLAYCLVFCQSLF